jgi:hypothetical protein
VLFSFTATPSVRTLRSISSADSNDLPSARASSASVGTSSPLNAFVRIDWGSFSARVVAVVRRASAVQKYVGIAPVTERSGNQSWVHWRWACSTFVRQTFVEWASQTIVRSFWARAFYDKHRAKGASHNAAVRALAFKWTRILWRCWLDRVPYDEARYLTALQKRHSPLLTYAAQGAS